MPETIVIVHKKLELKVTKNSDNECHNLHLQLPNNDEVCDNNSIVCVNIAVYTQTCCMCKILQQHIYC